MFLTSLQVYKTRNYRSTTRTRVSKSGPLKTCIQYLRKPDTIITDIKLDAVAVKESLLKNRIKTDFTKEKVHKAIVEYNNKIHSTTGAISTDFINNAASRDDIAGTFEKTTQKKRRQNKHRKYKTKAQK